MPKKTSSDPRALEIKSLTARRPSKAGTAKKAIKKTTKTEQLDWIALRSPPIRQNAWPAGRLALPIPKPRDTQARIAHLEEQGAARRDAVPLRVVTASTDGAERSCTRAEEQEGQCDGGAEQRRGSEEEGGVCRGGSNGRERGGGAAAM
jgi:hypothetical protein